MAVRIAVCDDLNEDIEQIVTSIKSSGIIAEINTYQSAADLMAAFEGGAEFDLVFLDIEMVGLNGFQAAERLKASREDILIVFVTISEEYVYEGYRVAWRYLLKPFNSEEMQQLLERAQNISNSKIIGIHTTNGQQLLSLKSILYAEVKKNVVYIHTFNQQYSVNSTLTDIESKFNVVSFAKPHMSYLINLYHIKEVIKTGVIMKNEDYIPIARGRRNEFWSAYKHFIRSWSR